MNITHDNWCDIKEFLLFKRDERRRPNHFIVMRDFYVLLKIVSNVRRKLGLTPLIKRDMIGRLLTFQYVDDFNLGEYYDHYEELDFVIQN